MATDWSADPDFQYLAVDHKKIMKEQSGAFDGKKACWVPDEKEGFVRADIVSSKGDEITVKVVSTNQVRHRLANFRRYELELNIIHALLVEYK